MDVEKQFLPHLIDGDSMRSIVERGLQPKLFLRAETRDMFEFARDYYVRTGMEQVPTKELIEDEFPGWFKDPNNEWPDTKYLLDHLHQKLVDSYIRKVGQDQMLDYAENAFSRDGRPQDAVRDAAASLGQLLLEVSDRQRSEDFAAGFRRRLAQYDEEVWDENMERVNPNMGIPFGWSEVTQEMFGLKSGEFAVLVGAPSVGKSWCLARLAAEAARDGYKVYLASLENPKDMTMKRLDCLVSRIPWNRYERRTLTPDQRRQLRAHGERIGAMRDQLIVDHPLRRDERTIYEMYMRARHLGADLIVGDQLSWVKPRHEYRGNRSAQMEEIVTDIAEYSREFGIASAWASQLNREGAAAKRAQLHNIALSTAVEQIVDWAFFLRRTEEMRQNQFMLLEIMKARRNDKKAWLLDWRLQDETYMEVRREYHGE